MDKKTDLQELATAKTPYAIAMAFEGAQLSGASRDEIVDAIRNNENATSMELFGKVVDAR